MQFFLIIISVCDGLAQPLVVAGQKTKSCRAQRSLTVPLPQVSCYLILSQFGFGIVTLEDQQTSGCIPPSLTIPAHHSSVNVITIIYMITILQ